jgi:Spy/CpxP family protein refolding chaperone
MKRLYLIPVALLLIGLTTVVFAAPPDSAHPGQQGFHKQFGPHKFGPRLNLTDEQKGKMKEIRDRFQADVHDLKYDIRIKKIEVQKLFTDPATDDATLLAKEKELNGLKLKFMDRKAEMKVEFRKILTPEQIRMLDRIHWHHRGHEGRHGHHHHWQHHHGSHDHQAKMDKGPAAGAKQ